jgi:hypothetical protein
MGCAAKSRWLVSEFFPGIWKPQKIHVRHTVLNRSTSLAAFALLIYLVLCLTVGLLGTDRRSGYTGTVALAFVLTPFVVFVGLRLFQRRATQ